MQCGNVYYADLMDSRGREYVFKSTPPFPQFSAEEEELHRMPYETDEQGNVIFYLNYPNASTVVVRAGEAICALKKKGDYWTGTCFAGRGFIPVELYIDENRVLSPMLPIGFGSNEVINFIEVPEPDFCYCSENICHGTVTSDYVWSKVTGKLEHILIYLPPQYYQNQEERFPVLYLQHGYGENETVWVNQGKMNFIMDSLLNEEKAVPCIVVMANGMIIEKNNKHLEVAYRKLSDFIAEDVIPYVDRRYRTKSDRTHRAMAGLSMGSLQTSRTVFAHQELFSYAGIFSGFYTDFLGGDNDHQKQEYIDTFNENIKVFFRAMGDMDIYLPQFEKDTELLNEQGINYKQKMYAGGHEWKVWRKCFRDFMQLIFR